MGQISFSDAEYAGKRKKTRREVFLDEMELVVPWKALLGLIEPHYPATGRGRKPYPLESMLRVHLMQKWFALSDPAMEESLYEIAELWSFGLHEGKARTEFQMHGAISKALLLLDDDSISKRTAEALW